MAQRLLGTGDIDATEHDAVLGWLRGELRSITQLRPALIYSRIGRHNARAMIVSAAVLLLEAGCNGLVIHVDYARMAEVRRPPAEARSGFCYTKTAVLDAYEVLRQFIDATDDLRGVFAIAVVPPELMTDEARGLPAYASLQLRVADEVRDRRRAIRSRLLCAWKSGWRRLLRAKADRRLGRDSGPGRGGDAAHRARHADT